MKFSLAKKKRVAKSQSNPSFRPKVFDLFIVLSCLVLIAFIFGAAIYPSHKARLKQKEELLALKSKMASLKEESEKIAGEIGRLQTDDYIELIARKDLGLVKPGESAYIVVSAESDDQIEPSPPAKQKETEPKSFWKQIADFLRGLIP